MTGSSATAKRFSVSGATSGSTFTERVETVKQPWREHNGHKGPHFFGQKAEKSGQEGGEWAVRGWGGLWGLLSL